MNQKYKQNFIRAGALAREARAYGKSLIQKGASYFDVITRIQQKIVNLGAIPAFPPQIALDDVAAHFLPMPGEDIIFSDQVVKLDVGVCYQGAIGDCAVTIDLSGKYQKLVDAAEMALLNAENSLHVGQPIRNIGRIIAETIHSFGFNPIKNLSGHGLGEYIIHMSPTIPNYEDNSRGIIKPGMTFAIEPFATDGAGLIKESGQSAIFGLGRPRPLKSQLAKGLLEQIRSFSGLPFAIHDLIEDNYPIEKVVKGLDELLKLSVVIGYPPLVEQRKGIVAQAENSVLVDEKGIITITTR